MFLEGSKSFNIYFDQDNTSEKLKLVDVNELLGDLTVAREHHDIRISFKVESLRLTYYLENSLPVSDLPNIYPEDGDAIKLQKFVASNSAAPSISLKLTDENNIVACPAIPIQWKGMALQMNLLKPWLITGESGVLLMGEGQQLFAEIIDDGWGKIKMPTGYTQDYLQIFGMCSYTISGVKKNRIITSNNLGLDIPTSPIKILEANDDRCKLIIQNNSGATISLAFGEETDCVIGQCLAMPPGSTFNEEFYPCNPLAIWAIADNSNGKLLIREDTGVRI